MAHLAESTTPHRECVGCPYATRASTTVPVSAFDGYLVVRAWLNEYAIGGKVYRASPSQGRIMAALAKRAGDLVTLDHLYLAVASKSAEDEHGVLSTQILRLRRKLAINAPDLRITTVRAAGMRLDRIS